MVRWVWNEGERQVVDAADVDGIAASIDLDPPFERVRMVWAIGLNYRDHAAETGAPIPTEPAMSCKRAGSHADQLVFDVPQLIAHSSQGLTLEPGDVILTGTPGGVGMARSPQRWLEDGDAVEITIAGIGTLRNRVIRR